MENKIKTIADSASKRGYEVKIRDIAYAALKVVLGDSEIPYTVVFGSPERKNDIDDYDSLDSVKFLSRWFEKELAPKEVEKERPEDIIRAVKKKTDVSEDGSMSFEENRAGIEKQIAEVLELKKQLLDADGLCTDLKTMAILQKTEMEARAKLNDKFGASEKSNEQYIIVQPKFNTICEYTRRECWQQTREFAMQHWHLIPDPNYKEK